MATVSDSQIKGDAVDIDLPSDRKYKNSENAELDAALVTAIKRAENAENDFLARLLRKELKSHYYESKL